MDYPTLIAGKSTRGSIQNWTNYSLLDSVTIVDEAQSLLYGEGRLRTREMTTELLFTMPVNSSYQPLPTGFLDPIGRISTASFNNWIGHKDPDYLAHARNYTETTGTLATNPLTATSGSNTITVNLPGHGFTQDSVFYTTGATAMAGMSVPIAGTFPISGIIDANNFTIDITSLGATPSASGTGGGSAIIYTCDALTAGAPLYYAIWNERFNFDQAFFQTTLCRLQYYQSLPLLSASNPTNFLTNRYPKLMRIACMAAAAEFMKDDTEYQKWLSRLQSATEASSNENDMQYRSMELDTDTP